MARDQKQEDHDIVAVVGDGALTAGMAFEALNHAGHMGTRLTVVLNDNEMSIAPNVGALSQYLTRIRMDPTLSRTREEIEQILGRIPAIGDSMLRATDRAKKLVKQLVVPGMLFEELGFTYIGPVDGHDVGLLQRVFREALRRRGPVLVHVITQKGKGHGPSERNPVFYHGTAPNRDDGISLKHTPPIARCLGLNWFPWLQRMIALLPLQRLCLMAPALVSLGTAGRSGFSM